MNDKLTNELIATMNIDAIMCAVYNVNKLTIIIPYVKESDIKIGAIFWSRSCGTYMSDITHELITITHIRGDVVFYTTNSNSTKKEQYFEIGSLMSNKLGYEHYISDLDPKFYDMKYNEYDCKVKYVVK